MRYVVNGEQMRALDQQTIEGIGLPGIVLMETAGRAVADCVQRMLRAPEASRVAVVCGTGNNGGDGYVVARVLRARGISAVVYLAGKRETIAGDAAAHLSALEQSGGVATAISDSAELAEAREAIESADLIVDAVLGTGLCRQVTGHLAQVIDIINRCPGFILSVDVPSGMSSDTGALLGPCVQADQTVTLGFLKVGLLVGPGRFRCGAVQVAEIGIPEQLAPAQGVNIATMDAFDARVLLRPPDLSTYKNRRGHVLACGGAPGRRGAIRLSARAALRAGAGLVTVAGDSWDMGCNDPIMTAVVDPSHAHAAALLANCAQDKQALALGPGLAATPEAKAFVLDAIGQLTLPMVIDADGLGHLVGHLDVVRNAKGPVVLTPHPGEAARLLGSTSAEVEQDRIGAVRTLARDSGAVVVLKGPGTLVCDGRIADEFVTINCSGGPALATAGSGDVLTGVIAALIAQGLGPGEAARLGAFVHGLAGDRVADNMGNIGANASDIVEALPGAFKALG